MPPPVTCRAYAKVNLALAVGAPIAPPSPYAGYHPIASWMAGVDLFDEVEITPGAESACVIEWAKDAPRPSPIDWPIGKDLARRAHRLLEAEVGRPLPAAVRVSKRIPVGGGLGGGSANAAATLLAFRRAFSLDIDTARLAELSVQLGSDVAFFLDDHDPPRPALVTNLGDRIERVPGLDQPMTLFFPPFGCPTGAVYKAFDAEDLEERAEGDFAHKTDLIAAMARSPLPGGRIATDSLFNDLASPACRIEPRLRDIINRLSAELNANVHVTGSGSTLFALGATPAQADRMAARAVGVIPGLASVATRIV